MAVGQIITASRYNMMQSRVALILGIGSERFGYGQPVISSSVSPNVIIDETHMNKLKQDLINCAVHQTGVLPILPQVASRDEITESVYREYETLSNIIFNNRDNIFTDTQASFEVKLNVQRTESWGGAGQPQIIAHEFNVVFETFDDRRYFFNTGGEIRFSTSLTSSNGAKSSDWVSMLNSVNIVTFSNNGTIAGSGFTTSINNFDLTDEYQTIYSKFGSGLYSENSYIIKAKLNASNIINFSVEYSDGVSNFEDESVNGKLVSNISQLRATGQYVEAKSPIYQNVKNLSTITPLESPTYILRASSPEVLEGNFVIINLTTTNVPNGEVVPYNIRGVTSADISGAPLSGNFQVFNNGASITINIATDSILANDDNKLMTVRLANGFSNVSVNIIDTTPDPVYSLTASNSAVYEGFDITFDLDVQNLPAGTQIPYTISGVSSDDIEGQSLTGNFTIDGIGKDSLTLPVTLDDFEESETLTLSIDNTSVSVSVQILDASYTLFSNNLSPNEGDTITITLVTNEVPNNTVVPYTISGVSSNDINIPLIGSFTVINNQAQVSITFISDAEVEPDEQFTLSLDNGKSAITLTVVDTPIPTSANRTCIAVIDEASSARTTLSSNWTSFRTNWPNRPFYLLQPGRTRPELYEPAAFVSDPLTEYSQVNRDNGNPGQASDWYTLCNLDQLPDGSKLALFIDTSGSMTLSTVQASYNLFKQKIQERNMTIIEVFNRNENWILPFDTILD